jgi:hypothetical protein
VRPLPYTSIRLKHDVADAVRLLHRRRGWVWTAVVSAVVWLVTLGLLGALAPNARGAGEGVAAVFVLLLTIVAVVALVASVVDTVKLHRLDPGVRDQARQRTTHHPLTAHAYRYPPHHRVTWVIAWVGMAIIVGVGVAVLPGLVNGLAYLAGAEQTVTFSPTAYGQQCGRYGCSTITNGFLQNAGHTPVTWPGQVPLGQPFPVREPVWAWGFGSQLIDSDPGAVGTVVAGLFVDGLAVLVLWIAFKAVRNWRRHRQQGAVSGLPG